MIGVCSYMQYFFDIAKNKLQAVYIELIKRNPKVQEKNVM